MNKLIIVLVGIISMMMVVKADPYKAPAELIDKATAVEMMYESLDYIYYRESERMWFEAGRFETLYIKSGYNDVPTEFDQRKMLRAWLATRYIKLSGYSPEQCLEPGYKYTENFVEEAKNNVMRNITDKDIEIVSKYYFLK